MAVSRIQELIGLMQKNLECSICLELMTSPVATKCEHYFCRFCITEFLEKKRSVPCPLCKQPVTKRSLKEKGELNNIVHAINDMIIAFEQDSGVTYSPPSGPQTFFPCTPDTINNKLDSHQTKPRKNVRHTSRTSKPPGKGASGDTRQSHIANSSEDVFAVPSTSGVSVLGRRKSPAPTSRDCDTSTHTTSRPRSRPRQVHPATGISDQSRSRLRQNDPASDTSDKLRSRSGQIHPASDNNGQSRSRSGQVHPVSDTNSQTRSRSGHVYPVSGANDQPRSRSRQVHPASDTNNQSTSQSGQVHPVSDVSDVNGQPTSRSGQVHPISDDSDYSRLRSKSIHSASDTNDQLLRCLDENLCGWHKETQDAACLPQTFDDSCAKQANSRVSPSLCETNVLRQSGSCLVTNETEVDASRKTEIQEKTVQINEELPIHNEEVVPLNKTEQDHNNVNLVKKTSQFSETDQKIAQRESNERNRRLKCVNIESERSKEAQLDQDRSVESTENHASDQNNKTNQQKTTHANEAHSTNDDDASSSQFRPLPMVIKTYSRRSSTKNSTNWNACLPSSCQTSAHKQSDSATDLHNTVKTQGNDNSNNQKHDITSLNIAMTDREREQNVSKDVFEQNSDRPDFASESYEEFMLTPPVRKKHIFKRKGSKNSVNDDHSNTSPFPVEELSPPADPYLFVVGHTPVAKSKKRGRPRSKEKKGKPPTMASLAPSCRERKTVSFSDVTHCEEIQDTSLMTVKRTEHQTETDTTGPVQSLDKTPPQSCLPAESVTIDASFAAVTDLTDSSLDRPGSRSRSKSNSKTADSKKGAGRGKNDQRQPQKNKSKISKEETAEAERLREEQTRQLASWIGQAEDHDFLFSTQEAQASIESLHTGEQQNRAIALASDDDDDSNDGFCLMGPVLDDRPVRVHSSQQKANFDKIVAAQSSSSSDQSAIPDNASHIVEADNQKIVSLPTQNKCSTILSTNPKESTACGMSVSPISDASLAKRRIDTIAETPLSHLQSPGSSGIILPSPQAGTALPKFSTPIIQSARRTRLSKQQVSSEDGAAQKCATLTDINPSPKPGKQHKSEDPEISVIVSSLNNESRLVQDKQKSPSDMLTRSISNQKNREKTADSKSPSISNQKNQENTIVGKSPPNKRRSSDRLRRQKRDSNTSSPLITAVPSTFTEESSDVIVSSVVSNLQPDKQNQQVMLVCGKRAHQRSDLETGAEIAGESVKSGLQEESNTKATGGGARQTYTTDSIHRSQNNGEGEADAECCSSSTEDLDITPDDNEFEEPDMAIQPEEIQQKYSSGGQLTDHSAPSINCVSETQRLSAYKNSSPRASTSWTDTQGFSNIETQLPSSDKKKTETSVEKDQGPPSNTEAQLPSHEQKKTRTSVKNDQGLASNTENELLTTESENKGVPMAAVNKVIDQTENQSSDKSPVHERQVLTLNSTLTQVPESLSAVTHVPDSNVSTKSAPTDSVTQDWNGNKEQGSSPESSESSSTVEAKSPQSVSSSLTQSQKSVGPQLSKVSLLLASGDQTSSCTPSQSLLLPLPVTRQPDHSKARIECAFAKPSQYLPESTIVKQQTCVENTEQTIQQSEVVGSPSQSVLQPVSVKLQLSVENAEQTVHQSEVMGIPSQSVLQPASVKLQLSVENAEQTVEQSDVMGTPSQSVLQPLSVKLHSSVENAELRVQQSDLSAGTPSQSLLQPVAHSNAPDEKASSLMAPECEEKQDCSHTAEKDAASSSLTVKSLTLVQETQEPRNIEDPKDPSLSQQVLLESPPESTQLSQELNICDVPNTLGDGAIVNTNRLDSEHLLGAIAKSPEQAKNNQPSPVDSINQNSESLMSQSSPVSPQESEKKIKNIIPSSASSLKSEEKRKKAVPSSASSPQKEERKNNVIPSRSPPKTEEKKKRATPPSASLPQSEERKKKEVLSLASPQNKKRKQGKEVSRDAVDSSGAGNVTPDLFASPASKVVSSAPACTTTLSPDTEDVDAVLVVRRTKRKCFSLGGSPFKESTPLSVKRRRHRGKQTSLSEKFGQEMQEDFDQEERKGNELSEEKHETIAVEDKNQDTSTTEMNMELQETSAANKQNQIVSPGNSHSVSGIQTKKDGYNIDDTESPAKTGLCEKRASDINMKSDTASKPSPLFPRKKTVRGLARSKPNVAKNTSQQKLESTSNSGRKMNQDQINDKKASEMVVSNSTPVQNHNATANSHQCNQGQANVKASEMHHLSTRDVEDCDNTRSETSDLGRGVKTLGIIQSRSRPDEDNVLLQTRQPEALVQLTEDDDLMEVDDSGTSAECEKGNLQSKHLNQVKRTSRDLNYEEGRKTHQDLTVSEAVPPGSYDKPIIVTQSSNKSEIDKPDLMSQSSTCLDDATIPPPSFDLKFDEDEEYENHPLAENDNLENGCKNDAVMGENITTTNNFDNNGSSRVVEVNVTFSADKKKVQSKTGMAGDASSPRSSHESRNPTLSSEEEVVAVKKRKSTVIESDSDAVSDQDNDQDSEASFQLNFTSSSALSSQSEVINTQERSKMESELDRLRREIAEMEARLQGQPSSRSDSAGDGHDLATPSHHDSSVVAHRVSSDDSSDDEEMPDVRPKKRGKTNARSGLKEKEGSDVKRRRRHRYISSEVEEEEEQEEEEKEKVKEPGRQLYISTEEEEQEEKEKAKVKQPRRQRYISSEEEQGEKEKANVKQPRRQRYICIEEEEQEEKEKKVKQPGRQRYISSEEEEEKEKEKQPRRQRYISSEEEEEEMEVKQPRQQLMDSYLKDVPNVEDNQPSSVKLSCPAGKSSSPMMTTNQTSDRDSDQDSSDLFLSPLSPSPPPPFRQTLARKEPYTRPRSLFNLESPSMSGSRSVSKFRQSLDFADTATNKAHNQHTADNQEDFLQNSQESNSGLSGSLKNIPESQFSASGGADNAETSNAENPLRCISENAATPKERLTLNRVDSVESGDSPLPSPLKACMTTEGENKENIEDCDDGNDDDDLPRWKNKRFGFISSGLDQEKMSMLRKLAEANECKVYSKFNDHVTHVIIKTEREKRVCERTLKYFQGIAAGCWVLSFDWVLDSVRDKRFVPEKQYEIVGDSVKGDDHRGPERSRLSTSPFLQDFAFTSVGVSPDMSKKELSQLLTLCGGEMVEDPWALAAHTALHKLVLRCVDSEAQPPTPAEIELFNGQYKHFSLVTVAREWILDSICTHTLQPLEEYVFNTCPNLHLPF